MFLHAQSRIRLLNSLNPILLIFFTYICILLRTTGAALDPKWLRGLDILLPFIIYLGQRRSISEGLLLTLFISHLYSLSSSAPIGLFVLHYLCLFVIARTLSFVFYANRWYTIVGLILGLAALSRILLPLVAKCFGHEWGIFSVENMMPWGLVFITAFGFLVYVVLIGMDRLTFKAPRQNIEVGESEL